MLALFALAVLALAIARTVTARAADLVEPNGDGVWSSDGGWALGVRAVPVIIFDYYQPGVSIRHYWPASGCHHHYFPVTGKNSATRRRR
jgi:hypothetical protein